MPHLKQTSDNQTAPELVTGKRPWNGNSKPTFVMLFWNKGIYKLLLQGCTQYQIYQLLRHFPVPTSDQLRATSNASASVPIL